MSMSLQVKLIWEPNPVEILTAVILETSLA